MALLLFIKQLFRREAEGFSLIGVMIASSIGLIVIAGMTQLFVNMGSQIKLMENRGDLRSLKILLERRLQDMRACQKTLNTSSIKSFLYSGGAGFLDFTVIKDSGGNTVIDLSSASDIEARYGLTGYTRFRLQCGISACKDCSAASNWENVPGLGTVCQNQWNISLISQSALKGVTRFNKPQDLVTVRIDFTSPTAFSCGGISLGALLASTRVDCIKIKGGVSDGRTLIGCGSTQNHTAKGTSVFGFQESGKGVKSTGENNSFFGYRAGESNTTGESNTFLGNEAGKKNTTGKNNTFAGYQVGIKNTKGENNSFFGNEAGKKNTTGKNNTFIGGGWAGGRNTTGKNNIFIGLQGALGKAHTGSNNTSIGDYAAQNNKTGSNNIYIGQVPAVKDGENKVFLVGQYVNKHSSPWLYGEIGTKTLKMGGPGGAQVEYQGHSHTPSSKVFKKNIKPFKNFKKALQDILKTPLFTFQLKEDKREKERMGVISEELPLHLQIKEKGEPSHPDWTSIYGTIWGAIKALYKLVMEFKAEHQESHRSLSQANNKLFREFKKEHQKSRKSLSRENKNLKKEIERLKGQIKDIKERLRKNLERKARRTEGK